MPSFKSKFALNTFRLAGLLPLSFGRAIGKVLGDASYVLKNQAACVTKRNLDLCLPQLSDNQRRRLCRQSLQETGKVALETCHLFRNADKPIQRLILKRDNEALPRSVLESGKGLLILAPHLGNWEVLGLHLSSLGKVTNLYQPPKLAAFDTLIRSSREKSGATLVPTTTKGVAALLKNLRNGGIAGILPDQNPNDENSGHFAPFFGQPAFTMVLIHRLIQKTGCRAVFAFAKRIPGGFELVYREPPEEIYSDDMEAALAALNKGTEALVTEAPEQYQWEYKRFKIKPEGSEELYPRRRLKALAFGRKQ